MKMIIYFHIFSIHCARRKISLASSDHSHTIQLAKPNRPGNVPCFVGGLLPRRDVGNQEDYSLAMLTLFRPWRSGEELKAVDQTWEAAFSSHVFTDRQKQLMDFFQIRYECNDSRDDFHAQRRKANTAKNPIFGQFASELDAQHGEDEATASWNEKDVTAALEATWDEIGRTALNKLGQMIQIEKILDSVGWSKPLASPTGEGLPAFVHGKQKTGSEWKSALAEKRSAVLENKRRLITNTRPENAESDSAQSGPFPVYNVDAVEIIDKAYLDIEYKAATQEIRETLDKTVADFTLNEEQERAFRIIANHSVDPTATQLKMYIGGMGGTGKSQVIKALTSFFNSRGQSYAFMILAPTGSAAALVAGSTYHSVLGFGGGDGSGGGVNESQGTISAVREKLANVKYVFMDEISMVDCNDFYHISAQMSRALNIHTEAFGGMNMIVAGDFAQLPPISTKGPALYSHNVSTILSTTNSAREQNASMGKALWHQFSVVVMLRQNMRQKTQSVRDAKFRTALENMRYKSCTDEDIDLIRSRIVGPSNPDVDLSHPNFRYVSVITALNSQRDRINDIGCEKFAKDTNQELRLFYSVDKWRSDSEGKKTRKKVVDPVRTSNAIAPSLQEKLHQLPPGATAHLPGLLKLCIGLPVLIKKNEATELCVTNGAEGTVAGWQSRTIPDSDKETLDVVFVKLTNPPQTVQLPDLPENVVPVAVQKAPIRCDMPNDGKVNLMRGQVPLIPNFAMTDYGSQGRTRIYNVVDLRNCRTCQSIYTCLSRSASLDGTVLVQDFDASKIQGGLSGYLRQEFRELELLNEITRRRYCRLLPEALLGENRTNLIHQFWDVVGKSYRPEGVHPSIAWSDEAPLTLSGMDQPNSKDGLPTNPANESSSLGKRKYDSISSNTNYVVAQGTEKLTGTNDLPAPKQIIKRRKTTQDGGNVLGPANKGLVWDGDTWSCAYDSVLTILFQVYNSHKETWLDEVRDINDYFRILTEEWNKISGDNQLTHLEDGRRRLQLKLHETKPQHFPMNDSEGTDINDLVQNLFNSSIVPHSVKYRCRKCQRMRSEKKINVPFWFMSRDSDRTVAAELKKQWCRETGGVCSRPDCSGRLMCNTAFDVTPLPFIIISLTNAEELPRLKIKHTITIGEDDNRYNYKLKGIVYHGLNHFTCRIVGDKGDVRYHDGMETKRETLQEVKLTQLSNVFEAKNRKAAVLIYSKIF